MPEQYYNTKTYQSKRSIGYLLRRSGKLITAKIESLFVKEEDINFVQWVILMHLRDKITMTSAELCQHLCHDSGALTRIIDQMEERGLIKRQRSTEDRRMISLELTRQGEKIIEKFMPRLVGLYNGLLTNFTQEETETLINLLTRLIDNLTDIKQGE